MSPPRAASPSTSTNRKIVSATAVVPAVAEAVFRGHERGHGAHAQIGIFG